MLRFFASIFIICSCIAVFADDQQGRESVRIPAHFMTGYSLGLSRADSLGVTYGMWDGRNMKATRGDVGEVIAEKDFLSHMNGQLKSGDYWLPLSPRFGRKGFDHVFVKCDKNGVPRGIVVAESKFGSSRLGVTRDGKQMSTTWVVQRLRKIQQKYAEICEQGKFVRNQTLPMDAKVVDVPLKNGQVYQVWKGYDGVYYTNAPEGISDGILKKRAESLAKLFDVVLNKKGEIRRRIFYIKPCSNGDVNIKVCSLDESDKEVVLYSKTIPREFMKLGVVDQRTIEAQLKRKHPNWPDEKVRNEAREIKKGISYKNLIEPENAYGQAISEVRRSAMRGAVFTAFTISLIRFMREIRENGGKITECNFEGIAKDAFKAATLTGVSCWCGQRVSLALSCRVGSLVARRIGGAVSYAILSAGSLYSVSRGLRTWQDATVDTGVSMMSMIAGHYAGVSTRTMMVASVNGSCVSSVWMGALANVTAGVALLASIAVSSGIYAAYEHHLSSLRERWEIRTLKARLEMIKENAPAFDDAVDLMLEKEEEFYNQQGE